MAHGRLLVALSATLALTMTAGVSQAGRARPHNVILFVADGLRSGIVDASTAPALAALRAEGVDFRNSHSMFPTVTTVNAASLATGHFPGDTGDFGNGVYVGAQPLGAPINAVVAPLENEAALGLMNQRFSGNYLGEVSLLEAARAKGYSTASIGKLGPTAVQDVAARSGESIVVDDMTGDPKDGLPLPPDFAAELRAAGIEPVAADRKENAEAGDFRTPGTLTPNTRQQAWFSDVATRVVLPRFKKAGRPFVMVYWSRDPDGTQHNGGDSLNALAPGINGPTSMAAIRNASDNLQRLRAALRRLGLEATTDIVAVADHGFSTISKQSRTSEATKMSFRSAPPGSLPSGFMAIDLAKALELPLWDARGGPIALDKGQAPAGASLLGKDPRAPEIVVAANGGTNLLYLPGGGGRELAARIVDSLTRQDYVAALFVDDGLGPIPGALPLSAIRMDGSARTPRPAMAVSFRSFDTGCGRPELCAAEVADTTLQQGQGIHGTLSRADTHNFMAAVGPDFKRGFVDPAPVGNAAGAPTLARVLRLDMPPRGKLRGRVLYEALKGGRVPPHSARTLRSKPGPGGFITVLNLQEARGVPYFDAAGAPGRTVGLKP